LEHKFGVLDAAVRDRIAHADSEQLLTWGERVLTAQRLEEVLQQVQDVAYNTSAP
jgi:hypothetical protein